MIMKCTTSLLELLTKQFVIFCVFLNIPIFLEIRTVAYYFFFCFISQD